jgi:hypothetical protein
VVVRVFEERHPFLHAGFMAEDYVRGILEFDATRT